MAVLEIAGHIHGDTLGCIQYIQNPEKTVYGKDTAKVIRYMQSHCVEDVMSVGYNGTSGDRELAVEQFRFAEAAYNASHPARKKQVTRITVEQYLESNHKRRLPKHIKPDADGMITITKEEVTAEHIVLSLHKTDRTNPARLQAVLDEFMRHPYFRNYPALSNLHWNTDEPHAHILVSNFAKDGSRKLSLTGTKLRELQRHLDKICYRHGLSIIDSNAARLDPDHAAWIDRVKAEGRIKVWPAKNRNQTNWKAADNRAKAEVVGRILAGGDMSEAAEKRAAFIIKNDLFVGYPSEVANINMLCPTWFLEQQRRKLIEAELKHREKWRSFYYVRRKGNSDMVSCYVFLDAKIRGEFGYIKMYRDGYPTSIKLEVDQTLQTMMDSIALCREFNVRYPEELEGRRADIGAAIGDTKRAIAYDQKVLARTELVEAVDTWMNHKGSVSAQEAACELLESYGYTDYQKRSELAQRVLTAQKRLFENESYLADLNRSYRDMSKGIAVLRDAENLSDRLAHDARATLEERAAPPTARSLNDIISNADRRRTELNRKTEREPEH